LHFFSLQVLLIAKRLNGAKMKYRLRVYITLRTAVKVVDVPDSSDVCEFRILAPTKTFVLFGRSKEEKLNWIRWINNTIKSVVMRGERNCELNLVIRATAVDHSMKELMPKLPRRKLAPVVLLLNHRHASQKTKATKTWMKRAAMLTTATTNQ
jgi:hypothetical protein